MWVFVLLVNVLNSCVCGSEFTFKSLGVEIWETDTCWFPCYEWGGYNFKMNKILGFEEYER